MFYTGFTIKVSKDFEYNIKEAVDYRSKLISLV
jgi:hypothetical protein